MLCRDRHLPRQGAASDGEDGANGVAVAPAFTANGDAGPFTLIATAGGLQQVSFSLTNR
jgi:hypothetical protein